MTISSMFEKMSLNTIEILFVISYVILASLMMGLTIFNRNTYEIVQTTLQLVISIFIAYQFNPFNRKTSITDMERRIIFSCSIYLFLATIPYHYISQIYI